MTCVFIIAALKQEADLYLAQGLDKEALDLYDRFLRRVSSLDSALRMTLEADMARIRARMNAAASKEEDWLLDDAAMTRIKMGWRGAATANDRLVSARALRKLGRHHDALEEYRNLLAGKKPTRDVVEGVADCLVHLTGPHQFTAVLDRYLEDIFRLPENHLMFKLLVAKVMDVGGYPHHFKALYGHLIRLEPVPDALQAQIQSLGSRLPSSGIDTADGDAYGPLDGLDFFYCDWTRREE